MVKMENKTEAVVYLISFLVLGGIIYLHETGVFNPFNDVIPTSWGTLIVVGMVLGMLLNKGLSKFCLEKE